MFTVYLACTVLTALACCYAVYLNVTRAPSVVDTAHNLSIPVSLMPTFGVILGLAAVGLLIGLAFPIIGTAAAGGLVIYFVVALATHIRARDRHLTFALIYLALATAALITGLAYQGFIG